jgi:hypothetical protein
MSCLGRFFVYMDWNINGGDHQGGTGNGLIVSRGDACLGKVLARYSKGVITVWLLEEIALRMAALTGWLTGGVCVSKSQDCKTLRGSPNPKYFLENVQS